MTVLAAIADDLTGACDVGAELAAAGHRVWVRVDSRSAQSPPAGTIAVANTQSRALTARDAYRRVRETLGDVRAPVLLKKIDTALRGHLGAELDAALDASGAAAAFIVAAIPAAGRVTRNGCQWFDDRPLGATEFARDPEGPGAESSIAAVVGRESRRRAAVIGCATVAAGRLAAAVGTHRREEGTAIFVVDAETDADVAAAVAAILALPPPVCLAGSIALAGALAPLVDGARSASATTAAATLPALVVSGSLHSRARQQMDAVLACGLATAIQLPAAPIARAEIDATAAAAAAGLAAGASVVVAPAAPRGVPSPAALRDTEDVLAEIAAGAAARVRLRTLVVVGGETSHAVLGRLETGAIAIGGRVAPLIAHGTLVAGAAAGATLVIKGGSGGDVEAIARLLAGGRGNG